MIIGPFRPLNYYIFEKLRIWRDFSIHLNLDIWKAVGGCLSARQLHTSCIIKWAPSALSRTRIPSILKHLDFCVYLRSWNFDFDFPTKEGSPASKQKRTRRMKNSRFGFDDDAGLLSQMTSRSWIQDPGLDLVLMMTLDCSGRWHHDPGWCCHDWWTLHRFISRDSRDPLFRFNALFSITDLFHIWPNNRVRKIFEIALVMRKLVL